MASNIAPFQDAKVLREWDDGYTLVEVKSERDLITLTNNGGGCSAAHGFWTALAKPQCEFFFVFVHHGKVGTIYFSKRLSLFGKKHPQEKERYAWYLEAKNKPEYAGLINSYSELTADYYDRYMTRKSGDDLDYYRRNLAAARAEYEAVKEAALKIGPLRKGHPDKWKVDNANRYMISCQKQLEKMARINVVTTGTEFTYKRTKLFIVQVSGRGVDYSGDNTRYTDRFAEYFGIGKEKHGTNAAHAAPERV